MDCTYARPDSMRRAAQIQRTYYGTQWNPEGTGWAGRSQKQRAVGPRIYTSRCAPTTNSLFGSHMFGYFKGSFSEATYTALGSFRAAVGRTIFLDEIDELEPPLQAKLLRVLQQRTVVPVSCDREIPVDVRVIAASNRNLQEEEAPDSSAKISCCG